MKSHILSRARSGFTLIELLIVIVIIAVLASVAFPVTAMVMQSARKAEAQNEVRNIVNAINMYKLEYGRLPLPPGSGGDIEFSTDDGDLIAILSGVNKNELNPREKVFLEAKQAKGVEQDQPRGGIYGDDEDLYLADPWGNPYWVMVDADYDSTLRGVPGFEGGELRKEIVAWSEGPPLKDGAPAPVGKWLKSWE